MTTQRASGTLVCSSCGAVIDDRDGMVQPGDTTICARTQRVAVIKEKRDAGSTRGSAGPATCAEVTFDMRGEGYGDPAFDAEVGDLLWNPKAGDGHVLVREVPCDGGRTADCGCGGWGSQPCPSTTLLCECGEDGAARDHHYSILARAGR